MSEQKHVLFFYDNNKWSNSLVTYLSLLKQRGYKLTALLLSPEGPLSLHLRQLGIPVITYSPSFKNRLVKYIVLPLILTWIVKRLKTDVVHSHTQKPNFIAVLSRFFHRARIIAFRHHFRPKGIHFSMGEYIMDKIINLLAPVIAVPAMAVKNGITKWENVYPSKIAVVPYIYDFSLYPLPDPLKVKALKERYSAKLLLIMVSRLIWLKRPLLVFKVARHLIEKGLDIKLIVMGDGPLKSQLAEWIQKNGLQNRIFLLGFKTEIMNYMAAADMLVSASMTDASNSSAKEMALLEKLVAVPSYVGDFAEYIIDEWNGFLLPANNVPAKLKEVIEKVYSNPQAYTHLGKRLKQTVIKRFDARNADYIIRIHEKLIEA